MHNMHTPPGCGEPEKYDHLIQAPLNITFCKGVAILEVFFRGCDGCFTEAYGQQLESVAIGS